MLPRSTTPPSPSLHPPETQWYSRVNPLAYSFTAREPRCVPSSLVPKGHFAAPWPPCRSAFTAAPPPADPVGRAREQTSGQTRPTRLPPAPPTLVPCSDEQPVWRGQPTVHRRPHSPRVLWSGGAVHLVSLQRRLRRARGVAAARFPRVAARQNGPRSCSRAARPHPSPPLSPPGSTSASFGASSAPLSSRPGWCCHSAATSGAERVWWQSGGLPMGLEDSRPCNVWLRGAGGLPSLGFGRFTAAPAAHVLLPNVLWLEAAAARGGAVDRATARARRHLKKRRVAQSFVDIAML